MRTCYEFGYILEGKVRITDDEGASEIYQAGDTIVTPKGFKGHLGDSRAVPKGPGDLEVLGRISHQVTAADAVLVNMSRGALIDDDALVHAVRTHRWVSDAVSREGIDLLTAAVATDLYADEDGKVTGVRIRRPDGSHENLGCGALVLACNGFGGNSEMVREHIPEIAGALYFGHVGNRETR